MSNHTTDCARSVNRDKMRGGTMNRLWLIGIGALALVGFSAQAPARAQSVPVFGVTTCGTPPTTIANGKPAYLTVLVGSGVLCTNSSGGGGGTVTLAPNVTPTDCSGTITAGGTAQNAIAAQTTLHGFTLANIDSTTGSGEPLWMSFTTTAASSTIASYPLSAPTATTFTGLSSYSSPPGFGTNHAVSVIGATTGHKFSCTWW